MGKLEKKGHEKDHVNNKESIRIASGDGFLELTEEQRKQLRDDLIAAQEARENGFEGYPADDVLTEMKARIRSHKR